MTFSKHLSTPNYKRCRVRVFSMKCPIDSIRETVEDYNGKLKRFFKKKLMS